MTDAHIQKTLTDAFLTLNASSGKPYINFVDDKPVNVAVANISFTPPVNNQYFVLSHLPGEPEPAGMGEYAENRWSGLLQVDIYSPVGKGEDEVNAKYEALSKLFERGKCFDEVVIQKVYCPLREQEGNRYRAAVRIEWVCDLPK
jgi:hypothetical protein